MKEHLIRLKLEADDFIDFFKETDTGKISLCSKENCADLPALTGLETTELFSLLEPLGTKVEEPAEEVIEEVTEEHAG